MRSKIAGIGYYVPETVVTNDDLSKLMDTSDAWIQERTGIKERRHVKKYADETTTILGAKAARIAIERAGIDKSEIDFIVFATLSPDYYFPGCGVLLQRELGLGTIGALDVRNQCSGFLYALSVADQFIKTGMYKNILVVGSEIQSAGLDYSDKGRNVTVIFGDGAGAVVLQPTQDPEQGILTTHLHSDGAYAEKLAYFNPGTHMGVYTKDDSYFDKENPNASVFFTQEMFNQREYFPIMEGQTVFKHAVTRFPEVIGEALQATNLQTTDIDLFIPHQANLRISQFVQARLGLPDEKVFNNIQKYGNTTAASIPIALCEAWEAGRIKKGDLICLAAFGSGFTWASALIRW